jgi:hypothetical protein
MAVHLTCYLSLRRHYPDQVHVVSDHQSVVNIGIHSPFTTHNNGFDLSLSFSLIAQSKAPLENYVANIDVILISASPLAAKVVKKNASSLYFGHFLRA